MKEWKKYIAGLITMGVMFTICYAEFRIEHLNSPSEGSSYKRGSNLGVRGDCYWKGSDPGTPVGCPVQVQVLMGGDIVQEHIENYGYAKKVNYDFHVTPPVPYMEMGEIQIGGWPEGDAVVQVRSQEEDYLFKKNIKFKN